MIKIKKIKSLLLAATVFLLLFSVVALPGLAHAQPQVSQSPDIPPEVQCGDSAIPTYTAVFSAKAGTYDAYIRLGRSSQKASATLYYQSLTGTTCQTLGTVVATGAAWQKIGSLNFNSDKTAVGTFSLASGAIDGLPDANRPTVMLISRTDPACIPTTECSVKVGTETGVVKATGTLLNEDTLHVVAVSDPAKDTVIGVTYYIDDRPAYTTKQLEPFDLRYVGAGSHQLTRAISYKSKQKVILSENIDRGFTDELNYLWFSFFYGQQTLLKLALIAVVVLLVIWIALATMHKVARQRLWKQHHFSGAHPLDPAEQAANSEATLSHMIKPKKPVVMTLKWLTFGLLLLAMAATIIIILNNFVMQVYSVDGPSMNSTLATGQKMIVDKLPQTWARIVGRQSTPARGTIVIVKKEQSSVFGPVVGSLPQEFVIKRVIGLPGERVTVKDGVITVYNSAHPDGFNPDTGAGWATTAHKSKDDRIDVTLGVGELFICGDNRPESIDSRTYGAVKVDAVVGRAVLRVSPLGKF